MTQSAQLISRTDSWPRIETCNIIALSDAHLGYATARNILSNPDQHILDVIDAALEVLSSSPSAGDRALCRKVADQLYDAQPRAAETRPNATRPRPRAAEARPRRRR